MKNSAAEGKMKMKLKMKHLSEARQVPVMLGFLCAATEKDTNLMGKVRILDRFGLSDDEIALICDCKVQSVRNARQTVKRK